MIVILTRKQVYPLKFRALSYFHLLFVIINQLLHCSLVLLYCTLLSTCSGYKISPPTSALPGKTVRSDSYEPVAVHTYVPSPY